ncbi:unnamed protein product [Choristocarpus tenellus]
MVDCTAMPGGCRDIGDLGQGPPRETSAAACSKAYGILASVEGDTGNHPGVLIPKLVFPVNGCLPLPTSSFGEVVSAAEERLRQKQSEGDQGSDLCCKGVMAAFCSGPSIVYYNVSSGMDVT